MFERIKAWWQRWRQPAAQAATDVAYELRWVVGPVVPGTPLCRAEVWTRTPVSVSVQEYVGSDWTWHKVIATGEQGPEVTDEPLLQLLHDDWLHALRLNHARLQHEREKLRQQWGRKN